MIDKLMDEISLDLKPRTADDKVPISFTDDEWRKLYQELKECKNYKKAYNAVWQASLCFMEIRKSDLKEIANLYSENEKLKRMDEV